MCRDHIGKPTVVIVLWIFSSPLYCGTMNNGLALVRSRHSSISLSCPGRPLVSAFLSLFLWTTFVYKLFLEHPHGKTWKERCFLSRWKGNALKTLRGAESTDPNSRVFARRSENTTGREERSDITTHCTEILKSNLDQARFRFCSKINLLKLCDSKFPCL